MLRNVTEVDFISDKIYDRVHDKDAFMSTVYRYKAYKRVEKLHQRTLCAKRKTS